MSTNAVRNSTTREAGQFGRDDRRLLAGARRRRGSGVPDAGCPGRTPRAPVLGKIQVPAGNKVFLVGHAVGVQIYACNGVAWSFVAPRADLFGDTGRHAVNLLRWTPKAGEGTR